MADDSYAGETVKISNIEDVSNSTPLFYSLSNDNLLSILLSES